TVDGERTLAGGSAPDGYSARRRNGTATTNREFSASGVADRHRAVGPFRTRAAHCHRAVAARDIPYEAVGVRDSTAIADRERAGSGVGDRQGAAVGPVRARAAHGHRAVADGGTADDASGVR